MGKGYIVCVDDQPAILDSLLAQLERAVGDRCEIEIAESADEALELLESLRRHGEIIEMLISDEIMPGIKGAQLLQIVNTRFPGVMKVMLTGQAGLDSVAYAINNANLDKYFTKPWEYRDLKLSVQNLLEKNALRRKNQRLTQELQEKYDELEQTYLNLSSAHKQLKETQQQLIHAEKLSLIGQLSSGIAHEVKNQLNMIGFAELIQDAYPADEKIQKYTSCITKAGNSIYNLVDEMRRFAKKEQRSYEMQAASVTEMLERLLHFVRFDTLLHTRTLTTDFQETPLALLNEDKFTQVMINLIRNAAHATQEGEGEISLRVTSHDEQIQVDVSDNGIGIPEEMREHIWEPFFTTKGDEGTGLGLDICKRIIEEHHGTISCESQLDLGSTFTILLPHVNERDA
ncbi:MAG: hybrid sensor histidine kinase/response regulator [bacterium]|nr:hybrid sensor histidine kinase/response regulator [bacterium]